VTVKNLHDVRVLQDALKLSYFITLVFRLLEIFTQITDYSNQ